VRRWRATLAHRAGYATPTTSRTSIPSYAVPDQLDVRRALNPLAAVAVVHATLPTWDAVGLPSLCYGRSTVQPLPDGRCAAMVSSTGG
jgi:hypothetical protein